MELGVTSTRSFMVGLLLLSGAWPVPSSNPIGLLQSPNRTFSEGIRGCWLLITPFPGSGTRPAFSSTFWMQHKLLN